MQAVERACNGMRTLEMPIHLHIDNKNLLEVCNTLLCCYLSGIHASRYPNPLSLV